MVHTKAGSPHIAALVVVVTLSLAVGISSKAEGFVLIQIDENSHYWLSFVAFASIILDGVRLLPSLPSNIINIDKKGISSPT